MSSKANFSSNHRFFREFKLLEAKLRKIANADDHEYFVSVLDKVEAKNSYIKNNRAVLRDLYALRNVFAHADREEYIAEVNQRAYEEIERTITMLDNPPKVGNVFYTEVYYVSPQAITQTVLENMKQNIYTHVPIYENGKFYGIFSESTILAWLVDNIHEGQAQFYKKQIKDVKRNYLHTPENKVAFISENTSIFEIPSYFENAIKSGTRLGAILITKDGTKDEIPIGIITAWDLPKIERFS